VDSSPTDRLEFVYTISAMETPWRIDHDQEFAQTLKALSQSRGFAVSERMLRIAETGAAATSASRAVRCIPDGGRTILAGDGSGPIPGQGPAGHAGFTWTLATTGMRG